MGEIVQEGEETVFRWMQPVRMMDTCLTCHGEAIDQRIKLLLAQEYPLDEAAGYSEGQIGGAYSVRKVLRVGDEPAPAWTPIPEPLLLPADQRQPGRRACCGALPHTAGVVQAFAPFLPPP
jgi:hypothetical protein